MDGCRKQIAALEERKKEIEEQLKKLYKILEKGEEMITEIRRENENLRNVSKISEEEKWISSNEEIAREEKKNNGLNHPVESLPSCVEEELKELKITELEQTSKESIGLYKQRKNLEEKIKHLGRKAK